MSGAVGNGIGETVTAQPALIVRRLDSKDRAQAARWDEFVAVCTEATFFHRSGWQTIVTGIFGHAAFFLYAERDGVIEGVLPLAQVKSRLFGNSLISLPFAVYGGVASS